MLTKFQLLNMVEEASCGKNAQEFVTMLSNHYQTVSEYMRTDKQFSESFKMSCIKLANTTSYMYHFVASLGLVGQDRPTSFATIMNLLHIVVSPEKHNRMMAGFLIKVMFLLSYLMRGIHAENYEIKTTENHVLISTQISTIEYVEITEAFSLDPIFTQIERLNDSLSIIQSLLQFRVDNRDCTSVGNLNSNVDSIEELVSIAIAKNLTKLRMQISEAGDKHKFVGFVVNENHQTSCRLTNSLANTQYLLAQNTFRNKPETDQQVIFYRDHLLSRFKDNYGRSCIRQGRFPSTFITRKFVVSQPQIENCAAICYFMLSKFAPASKDGM